MRSVGPLAHGVLYLLIVKNLRELSAAGVGGAVGTGVDIGLLALLVEHAHVAVPVAAFFGAAAGATVNFAINKYLAFRDRSRLSARQLGRFALVALATALLMAGAMKLVAVDLHVPYLLAKLVCAAVVFAVWTYPAQRRLVFRRSAHAV